LTAIENINNIQRCETKVSITSLVWLTGWRKLSETLKSRCRAFLSAKSQSRFGDTLDEEKRGHNVLCCVHLYQGHTYTYMKDVIIATAELCPCRV